MSHLFHFPAGLTDPNTWLWVALIAFIAMLAHFKIPKRVTDALDARADGIRKQLDDARRMREEAQEVLAAYQRRQKEAEAEAKAIIDQARKEADLMAQEARKTLAERLERRTAMAEAKIAQAEADAMASVRARAADLASEAAAAVIAETLVGGEQRELIDGSIRDLPTKL